MVTYNVLVPVVDVVNAASPAEAVDMVARALRVGGFEPYIVSRELREDPSQAEVWVGPEGVRVFVSEDQEEGDE